MPVGPASDVTPKAMRPPGARASLIGGFCLMAPWPPRVSQAKNFPSGGKFSNVVPD